MRTIVVVLCIMGCGGRTSPAADVVALVRARGADQVHRDLSALARLHPRDVSTRLDLAAVAELIGRPAEAIDELSAVERLGGPFGPRWRHPDRARLARLLFNRGRARLERGSPNALDDLMRASDLGAAVSAGDLIAARAARALSQLRHVDRDQRAKGRSTMLSLHAQAEHLRVSQRGSNYSVAGTNVGADPQKSLAMSRSNQSPIDPSWRGARSDAALSDRAAFGVWAWQRGARREAYDQLAAWHAGTTHPRDAHYESFFRRALAWWSPQSADSLPVDTGPAVASLDATPPGHVGDDARSYAVARFARARVIWMVARQLVPSGLEPSSERLVAAGVPDIGELVEIARAFRRSSARAAHLANELVARSIDASIGHATIGAVFDALGDPARSRAAWSAAASTDDEPAFAAGYAEACARGGDGAAALIAATHAAAACGDPAVVWNQVAQVLLDSGLVIDALTAARTAIDVAGPEQLPMALDIAIEASRQVGRTGQAEALAAQRGRAAPVVAGSNARDVDLRAQRLAALPVQDPRRDSLVAELLMLAGDRNHLLGLRAVFALREQF